MEIEESSQDLVIHFDINKTILMMDSCKMSASFESTLKSALSSHSWGKIENGEWIASDYPLS